MPQSQPFGGNQPPSEYERGHRDGKKAAMWRAIASIGGGFIFLLIVVSFLGVPQDLAKQYSDYQIKQQKIAACAQATDVASCVAAVG
ncbi:MAG TPA: hypothetical protein VM581_04290 [Magnetospirillaceae bacterium]|nr:hypothetical protein [Magnetospirillaceae bacterium]